MQEPRPYVLSIAGHDPSAGAGLLADIKTFEAQQCYGLSVCTAITYQNDEDFEGLDWIDTSSIWKQLEILLKKFDIKAVKIGILESFSFLDDLVSYLKRELPKTPIVLDPVLRASAGFTFHKEVNVMLLERLAEHIDLITPNWSELQYLYPSENIDIALERLGKHTAVLLKGGHCPDPKRKGEDLLYVNGRKELFTAKRNLDTPKHGSGCVLSAAIAAQLALGKALPEACGNAKEYTFRLLDSNRGALGFHSFS